MTCIRHTIICLLLACGLLAASPAMAAPQDLSGQLQQAKAGDREAQFRVAEAYYRGEGVRRNYSEALKWLRAAAEQGHAGAQYQLGYLHQHGPAIVNKDDKQAFAWYLKAAEQGHVSAQTKVSMMYRRGKGVEKNPEQARKWSMAVLKSKGLLEEEPPAAPGPAAARPENASKPASPAVPKADAPRAKPATAEPATTTKTKTRADTAAKPQMTAEQRKAWRREQARKLVEKMNREAAAEAGWSDVEDE